MVHHKIAVLEGFTRTVATGNGASTANGGSTAPTSTFEAIPGLTLNSTCNILACRFSCCCPKKKVAGGGGCCKKINASYEGGETFTLQSDSVKYSSKHSVKEISEQTSVHREHMRDFVWKVVEMKADKQDGAALDGIEEIIYTSILISGKTENTSGCAANNMCGNHSKTSYFVNYATTELLRRGVTPKHTAFNDTIRPNHKNLRVIGKAMAKLADPDFDISDWGCCGKPWKRFADGATSFQHAPNQKDTKSAVKEALSIKGEDSMTADETTEVDAYVEFISSLKEMGALERSEGDGNLLCWVIVAIVALLIAVAALFYKKFYQRKQVLQTITSSSESAAGSLVGMTLSLCVVGFVAIAMILRTRASKSSSKDAITSVELTELALLHA